jgi:hypothetical protein
MRKMSFNAETQSPQRKRREHFGNQGVAGVGTEDSGFERMRS